MLPSGDGIVRVVMKAADRCNLWPKSVAVYFFSTGWRCRCFGVRLGRSG